MKMRPHVGIIGAGPAGLLLSHLLASEGIDSVVLESRSRAEVEATIRAGVLEHGTVDLLRDMGLGERMQREGAVHHGIELRFDGEGHRIPLTELTNGRSIMIYPQHEVLKDLIAARLEQGGRILFNASDVRLADVASSQPGIHFVHEEQQVELQCDFIAGCDGFHGVSRAAIPAAVQTVSSRTYPFGCWRCAALSSNRCSTVDCFWPGMPLTLCLRRGRKGSIWPSPMYVTWHAPSRCSIETSRLSC